MPLGVDIYQEMIYNRVMSGLFKPDLSALVLGTLAAGPKHGYAITRAIREAGRGNLTLGEGQLYPVLHRLQELGFVSAEWHAQTGKPSRKVYTITEKGKRRLAKQRREWSEVSAGISSILMQASKADNHG